MTEDKLTLGGTEALDESKNPLIYEIDIFGPKAKFTILPRGQSEMTWAGMTYQAHGIINSSTMLYLLSRNPQLSDVTRELQKCINATQALYSKREYWGDNTDHIYSFYENTKNQSDRIISHFSTTYPNLKEEFTIPKLPQENIHQCSVELINAKHEALLSALTPSPEPMK